MTDTLGPYELVRLLGRGGMGEVHLATDTRLERDVALKLLPPDLADDPDRRARFLREARASAKLNHPNITTILEIGESGGRDYIAQEYLDGRPLSEIVAERSLPLAELANLAVPLADALAYAHERGVIHRDLKAANVIVTSRGDPKLLDFGLAKILQGEEQGVDEQSTTLTISGAVFGTPGAMSPEQALGKTVDARSDVFSFGSLLYEMATGKPAFLGTTVQETMDKVLHAEPEPLARLRRDLPSDVIAIVEKALRKDPGQRYQGMAELAADLRHFKQKTDSGLVPPGASRPARSSGARLAGAATVLVIVTGLLWWSGVLSGDDRATAPSTYRQQQLTHGIGGESEPSLSADGQTLFFTSTVAGNSDIFMRHVDGSRALNLTEDYPEDDFHPAVSRDGTRIAFCSDRDGGGVFVMGSLGESPRKISEEGFHPSWSPDGSRVAVCDERVIEPASRYMVRSALSVIDVASGEREEVYGGDAVQPRWSPDGQRLVAWQVVGGQRDLVVVPLDGSAPFQLTDDRAVDWAPAFSGDGRHVVYSSERGGSLNLWRIPVDGSGQADGPAVSLTSGAGSAGIASASADGRRIVFTSEVEFSELHRVEFDVQSLTLGSRHPLPMPPGFFASDLSPDGRFILGWGGATQEDVYRIDMASGSIDQLTNDEFNDRFPRYVRDGAAIVFYSNRSGDYEIWSVRSDGRDLRQLTDVPGVNFGRPFPSPVGDRLFLTGLGREDLEATPKHYLVEGSEERVERLHQVVPSAPGRLGFIDALWTPDGQAIVTGLGTSQSGPTDWMLLDIETMSYAALPALPSGDPVGWLPDGRMLLHGQSLVAVDLKSGEAQPLIGDLRDLPPPHYPYVLLSRDGKNLILRSRRAMSHLWLLER